MHKYHQATSSHYQPYHLMYSCVSRFVRSFFYQLNTQNRVYHLIIKMILSRKHVVTRTIVINRHIQNTCVCVRDSRRDRKKVSESKMGALGIEYKTQKKRLCIHVGCCVFFTSTIVSVCLLLGFVLFGLFFFRWTDEVCLIVLIASRHNFCGTFCVFKCVLYSQR